ncbi:MAG: DeoR family transcriptional regulator [Myxococcales bacterium]|nr:DeoR family transcriptional regulator [Myxococcales bacterium]
MSERAPDVSTLFANGRYADVVLRIVDAPVGAATPAESAHGAAALACVGRLDDAAALLGTLREAPVPALATARFFLAVAHMRAGHLERAKELVVQVVRDAREGGDPLVRFYAWQGLACLRYFGGGLTRCAELARRALDAAFRAGSAYGRVLATDLRGHAFVHLGRVHAGIELLRRARGLAEVSGFAGHVAAIDHSLAIYQIRFGFLSVEEAVARVDALDALDCQDSYSAHNASIELSVVLAFAGRGTDAWALLSRVSKTFVPEGDHRLRVRFLAAAAQVAALREGSAAARRYVDEARRELAHTPDRALAVEVACARAIAAPPSDASDVVAELLRVYQESGGVARALVHARALSPEVPVPASVGLVGFEEDRVGSLIASLGEREGPLKLLAEGYYGLYPRSRGLAPGARIHLLDGDRVLIEERGDLREIELSHRLAALLVALGRGDRSKEELLAEVWRIGRYDPERHDATLHTALSRLRAVLGPGEIRIESSARGYRLAEGVELVGGDRVLPEDDELEEPSVDELASRPPEPSREARLLALLASGRWTTRELAASLAVSEMTVLRDLKKLVASKLARRRGRGRATRYEAEPGATLASEEVPR